MAVIDEQTQNVKQILTYIFTVAGDMNLTNGEIVAIGLTCIQSAMLADVDIDKYAGYIKNASHNIIQILRELQDIIAIMETKQKIKK